MAKYFVAVITLQDDTELDSLESAKDWLFSLTGDDTQQIACYASAVDAATEARQGYVPGEELPLDSPDDDSAFEALLPDGSRCEWDERLRTVGALRVPRGEG